MLVWVRIKPNYMSQKVPAIFDHYLTGNFRLCDFERFIVKLGYFITIAANLPAKHRKHDKSPLFIAKCR